VNMTIRVVFATAYFLHKLECLSLESLSSQG
jgi:hypothetical protein